MHWMWKKTKCMWRLNNAVLVRSSNMSESNLCERRRSNWRKCESKALLHIDEMKSAFVYFEYKVSHSVRACLDQRSGQPRNQGKVPWSVKSAVKRVSLKDSTRNGIGEGMTAQRAWISHHPLHERPDQVGIEQSWLVDSNLMKALAKLALHTFFRLNMESNLQEVSEGSTFLAC